MIFLNFLLQIGLVSVFESNFVKIEYKTDEILSVIYLPVCMA